MSLTLSTTSSPVPVRVVVPAAGVGKRMGAGRPKQYLELGGKTLLQHTLEALIPFADGPIILCVAEHDQAWRTLDSAVLNAVQVVMGGAERSDTVLAGLEALAVNSSDNDWVMVLDAARPCVTESDIRSLLTALSDHTVGGILGAPLADTIKRVSGGGIDATEDRDQLWRALTPQVFRYGVLRAALKQASRNGWPVTDESSAVELCGHRPLMVKGRSDNLKITTPEDLAVAERLLQARDLERTVDHNWSEQ